jgi:hypothetical protein
MTPMEAYTNEARDKFNIFIDNVPANQLLVHQG